MGQTIYNKDIISTMKHIDKRIMVDGRNMLFKSRFGVGNKKVDCWKNLLRKNIKMALCMPTCIDLDKVLEVANKL